MNENNGNGRRGRPTAYREQYVRQAYHLALLGATEADLARAFDVSTSTITNWKNAHPSFLAALKRGRDEADANVAKSLYRRALGYKHRAVKIVADAKTGAEHQVPYTEHYPPDTTAAIFWLKNRRPDLWRDRIEHVGRIGLYRAIESLEPQEAERLLGLPDEELAEEVKRLNAGERT